MNKSFISSCSSDANNLNRVLKLQENVTYWINFSVASQVRPHSSGTYNDY